MYFAAKQNILRGRVVRGASTIDMQVASLCFDYPHTSSRWYSKAREVLLAFHLNRFYEKSEILKFYLSGAPLGDHPQTVGFLSAGRFDFHSEPSAWSSRQIWSLVTALKNRIWLSPSATHNIRGMSLRAYRALQGARAREREHRKEFAGLLEVEPWILP